jgi:hypothetical protein
MEGDQHGERMEVALGLWRRRKWLAVCIFAMVFTVVMSIVVLLPNI